MLMVAAVTGIDSANARKALQLSVEVVILAIQQANLDVCGVAAIFLRLVVVTYTIWGFNVAKGWSPILFGWGRGLFDSSHNHFTTPFF
jgi:hypothetical protein